MDFYTYAADTYCADCGGDIRRRLTLEGKAPEDPDQFETYESDDFPKGPFNRQMSESDSPNHCGAGGDCLNAVEHHHGSRAVRVGVFMENPLTDVGMAYVRQSVHELYCTKTFSGLSGVVNEWADFYEVPKGSDACELCRARALPLISQLGVVECRKVLAAFGSKYEPLEDTHEHLASALYEAVRDGDVPGSMVIDVVEQRNN